MTLGDLSRKYEVGDRGGETISTGRGDAGGVSYGYYQLTSKPEGGRVSEFVLQPEFPFLEVFYGLEPGSQEFNDAWKAIATQYPKEFYQLQHDFIERTHFQPLVNRVKASTGLNVTAHSNALQNVVWSVAVQHGPNTPIIKIAYTNIKNLGLLGMEFDKRLIKAIYSERKRKNNSGRLVYLTDNSLDVEQGVIDRYIDEEKDALKMLD